MLDNNTCQNNRISDYDKKFKGEKAKSRSSFKNFLTLRSFKNLISCSFLGLILTTIDVLTYGKTAFTKKENVVAENIGMIVYLYTTVIGQIIYNYFTEMEAGVMVFMIVENFVISRQIFETCHKGNDIKYAITNSLVCFSLSAIILAVTLFMISKTELKEYCKYLPKPTLIAYLVLMAWVNFHTGWSFVNDKKRLMILGILSSIILFIAEKKLHSPYVSSMIVAIFTLLFYLIMFIYFYFTGRSLTLSDIIEYSGHEFFLNKKSNLKFCPLYVFEYFSFRLIDYKMIFRCIPHILSMVLFALIQFPVAYPAFSEFTGVEFNFRDEIRAQAYSNLFSCFLFYPVYVGAAYSFSYYKSGSHTKYHGIFGSILYLAIAFIGSTLNAVIPKFVLAGIPMCIGYYYLSPPLKTYKKFSMRDIIITVISILLLYATDYPVIGIFASISICMLSHCYDYWKTKKTSKILENTNVLSPKILTFLSLYSFSKQLENMKSNVIINFTDCISIDLNAREYLIRQSQNKNVNFIFIGKPEDFIEFDQISGSHIKKYEDYIEYLSDV